MGRGLIVLRKLIFLCTAIYSLYVTYVNVYENINADGTLHLLNEYTESYMTELTSNTGYTNINGVSNFYRNMSTLGYKIHNEERTGTYIDVSFVKPNNPSYRLYYKYPECYFAIFSSDYENSWSGVAYISEEIKRTILLEGVN